MRHIPVPLSTSRTDDLTVRPATTSTVDRWPKFLSGAARRDDCACRDGRGAGSNPCSAYSVQAYEIGVAFGRRTISSATVWCVCVAAEAADLEIAIPGVQRIAERRRRLGGSLVAQHALIPGLTGKLVRGLPRLCGALRRGPYGGAIDPLA